jgi:hypothetical protein
MDRVKNKDFEFSKRKENLILEKEHSKQAKGPLFCCQVSSFSHFHIHFHTHTHTHTHSGRYRTLPSIFPSQTPNTKSPFSPPFPSKKDQTFLKKMKGKRKATANPVLADTAEGSSNSLIETQVREGNIGEEKEINWVDNGENREETEGEEEEEEDNDDEEEEEEDPKGKDEKGNLFDEERTKLDEGFFEIEAIRRKRVRKV